MPNTAAPLAAAHPATVHTPWRPRVAAAAGPTGAPADGGAAPDSSDSSAAAAAAHGLRVVLVHPQIPQNTGNVARTCAATGVPLHLVAPLGFEISDKQLKRAGLDYWDHVCVKVHASWGDFMAAFKREAGPKRLVAYTVYGSTYYGGPDFRYQTGDWLVFGAETTGLPPEAHDDITASGGALVKIPILTMHVRSLNLAVSAGIGVFEALRQVGSHEVAPRDDSGLRPTVMMRHKQKLAQQQQSE